MAALTLPMAPLSEFTRAVTSAAALALIPASVAGTAVDPLFPDPVPAAAPAAAPATPAPTPPATAPTPTPMPNTAAEARAAVPRRTRWVRACEVDMSPPLAGSPTAGTFWHPWCGPLVNRVLANREGSVRDRRIPAIRGAGDARLEPVSAEHGTVVLVEDDPHIADLVDLYLRRDGYRVLLAADGERGLEIFSQEDPAIVILDVGLPGTRDGFDVCREIRARGTVPVLFLTARDDEVDRILGLELGADDYLVKPFSPRELVARVRAILRRTREARLPRRSSAWATSRSTCAAARCAGPARWWR